MNFIKQFLKNKLSAYYRIIKPTKQRALMNKYVATIFYIAFRLSFLLPLNKFYEKEYQDIYLEYIKSFINWLSLLSPNLYINDLIYAKIICIVICICHYIVIIVFLFGNFNISILEYYIYYYNAYFQFGTIYISYLHLDYYQESSNELILFIITLIGIFFNYIISTFIQRNYNLPVINPYIKRHNLTNYLIIVIELIMLTIFIFINEQTQTYLLLIFYFLEMMDSLFVQPFAQNINVLYCFSSSTLFCAALLKAILQFWNQQQYTFFLLLLTPLWNYMIMQLLQFLYTQQRELNTITKDFLIQIIDEYYNFNQIQQNKIIYILKNRFKFEIFDQQQLSLDKIILIAFKKIIDKYNQVDKYKDEDLHLYKIWFIFEQLEKYILGYLELKRLSAFILNQSIYLKVISSDFISQTNYLKTQQTLKQSNKGGYILNNRLNLIEIRQISMLQEQCIPQILRITEQKIKYWEMLLIGYQNINEMAIQSMRLSKQINSLKDFIFQKLNINIFTFTKQLNNLNILDLKLLSLIFSSILNDYHFTKEIQSRIEEILAYERNLQTTDITNTTLLNEDVILVPISMIKNYGQILNTNKQKLQKFFRYPNDDSFKSISHIDELMPQYLKDKHNGFLHRFLLTGESQLFQNSHEVFSIYYSGFSFNVTLQLMQTFDELNDYILTAAIKKINENNDFIIFDETGKILGISESIQKILLPNIRLEFSTLILKSYAFYWFHHILEAINQNHEQISEYQLRCGPIGQQTSISPIYDIEKVIQEHEKYFKYQLFRQFISKTIVTENFDEFRSQITSFPCCQQEYLEQVQEFLKVLSYLNEPDINYNITFNLILHQMGKQYPLFVIQITEFHQNNFKKNDSLTYNQSLHLQTSVQTSQQQFSPTDNILQTEMQENEFVQNVIVHDSIINKLIYQYNKVNIPQIEIKGIDDTENQKSLDYRESNLISPRFTNKDVLIKREYIDEESEDLKAKESQLAKSSSLKEIKEDIVQIIVREQQNELQFRGEKNNSKSSGTTEKTQTSVFTIMRNLYYDEKMQTSIINALISSFLLTVFVIILIIIHLVLGRNNTNTLEYNIPLVRIPQRFNRLYCTFVTLGQLDLQYKLLNESYGDYYLYRIKNESYNKRIEIQELMTDLINEFASLEQNNKLPILEVRIINEYIYQLENMTMILFDTLVNQNTQQINQHLQSTNSQDISDTYGIQVLIQFLKGNLITQLQLTVKLVSEIEESFFNLITLYEQQYFIIMIVLLIVIASILLLSFRFWVKPYKYIQSVLLLISKISEKEIEIHCSRLYQFQDKLNVDELQWKHMNYYKEFFWQSRGSSTISYKFKQSINQGKSNSAKSVDIKTRYTIRIQNTQISILSIIILLIMLWLILSLVVIVAFIIVKINMDNAQPELGLAMEFVQFKQDLDGIMIIAQLLKNQQILITETMESGIFKHNPELNTTDKYFKTLYNEILSEFNILLIEMNSFYVNIYNDVVSSNKINDYNKQLLLNLYEKDLCEIIPQQLPFCNYNNSQFTYYPTFPAATDDLNNRDTFLYGINGIYQQIMSIINAYYSLEIQGIKNSNLTEVNAFLQSSEYKQIFLSYFFDQSYAILQFYYTIIQAALDVLEEDYVTIQTYYIITCIFSLIILNISILIKAFLLQQMVQLILQSLIFIPHDALLDQSILTQMRKLERTK